MKGNEKMDVKKTEKKTLAIKSIQKKIMNKIESFLST